MAANEKFRFRLIAPVRLDAAPSAVGHYGEVLDILRYIVLKNAIRLLELRVSEAEVCGNGLGAPWAWVDLGWHLLSTLTTASFVTACPIHWHSLFPLFVLNVVTMLPFL